MEKRIQEIRELEKQATPGPWENHAELGSFLVVDDMGMRIICDPIRKSDAALIVALRNNILAIMDDNERLRAENAKLRRERDAAEVTIDRAILWLFAGCGEDGFASKVAERTRRMLIEFCCPQEVEHG